MPTYLITEVGNDNAVGCTEITRKNVEGLRVEIDKGAGFGLPNGTEIFIDRAVIEKWAREFAKERLGELVSKDDFAPAGSKGSKPE